MTHRKTLLSLALASVFALSHTVVYAESDEKSTQPAPELIFEGVAKPIQPALELIAEGDDDKKDAPKPELIA